MNRACLFYPSADFASPAALEQARIHSFAPYLLCDDHNREAISRLTARGENSPPLLDVSADLAAHLSGYEEIVFLPGSDEALSSLPAVLPPFDDPFTFLPLFPPAQLAENELVETIPQWIGWRAGRELALKILREPQALHLSGPRLFDAIQHWSNPPRWQSIPLRHAATRVISHSSQPILSASSTVLAVVCFHRCEEWLHACLASLAQQSRPPDHVVVIDDSSPVPPIELVRPFPHVTLLSTPRNVGPDVILDNIIRATDYDAYMIQDSDDWSAHDRLELSLRAAEETGAEMIGAHEVRLNFEQDNIGLCVFPEDVNDAMLRSPGHHLLHCTSLIGRALAMRIGGFNGSLRLAGDTEFIHRAWLRGKIVNLPAFAYFRRIRPASVTTNLATGRDSAPRTLAHRFIKIRALRNIDLVRAGKAPDIAVPQTGRIDFCYRLGPALRTQKNVRIDEFKSSP